jgi:hypothetical protein
MHMRAGADCDGVTSWTCDGALKGARRVTSCKFRGRFAWFDDFCFVVVTSRHLSLSLCSNQSIACDIDNLREFLSAADEYVQRWVF